MAFRRTSSADSCAALRRRPCRRRHVPRLCRVRAGRELQEARVAVPPAAPRALAAPGGPVRGANPRPRARAQVRDERVPPSAVATSSPADSAPRGTRIEDDDGPGVVQKTDARRRVVGVVTVLQFAQERLGLGEEGFDGLGAAAAAREAMLSDAEAQRCNYVRYASMAYLDEDLVYRSASRVVASDALRAASVL